MLKGHIVKLYPNKAQAELLDKHFGCARFVYNKMIEINQKKYHRTGKGLSGYDMQNYLPKLKKQYPWLAEVNSQALQIVCHNLADGYNRFFKKQGGYPTFKKKSSSGKFSCINRSRIEGNKIRLPKLGLITFRGGDMPEGKIKRFTITKLVDRYYASILIETSGTEPKPKKPKTITGIDLGIKDMIVTSAGQAIAAPKYFVIAQKRLKMKQQALSRKQKGSKRRATARLEVARVHERTRNQRKDFHHKITRALVADSDNQAFAIESLNVKGMMANHSLAKHIADCAWSQFLTFLKYKSASVGKQVLEVGRFYPSSKICSDCGIVQQSLPLSVRQWTCSDCGSMHERDLNAAINIAQEAGRNFVSDHGGSARPVAIRAAAGEVKRTTVR